MLAMVAARLSDKDKGESAQLDEGVPRGEYDGRKSTNLQVLPVLVWPHEPLDTELLCPPVFDGAIRVAKKAVKSAEDWMFNGISCKKFEVVNL
jgi:hypothetical protein